MGTTCNEDPGVRRVTGVLGNGKSPFTIQGVRGVAHTLGDILGVLRILKFGVRCVLEDVR